ncbi:hypothetical protein NNO_2001 [Hydrogenimonas sp.]|nr:hypothetical protein NNO_2001 [Hydrogenimonas sp.]
MKRSFLIAATFAFTLSAFAQDTVYYADTTYGPSDTVVHYDNDRHQEKNGNGMDQTNIPNNDIYTESKDK